MCALANSRTSSLRLLALLQLLHDGQLDTLALGQRDHRLVALADGKHVRCARGELVSRLRMRDLGFRVWRGVRCVRSGNKDFRV